MVFSLALAVGPTATASPQGSGDAAPSAPGAGDKETARNLFHLGNKHYKAQEYQAALKAYTAADQLVGAPTTGFKVGRTLAKLGRLLEARDRLLAVARQPKKPGESPAFSKARQEASTLADELRVRIPTLVVQLVGAPDGAQVKVWLDGKAISPAQVGLPHSLDPGSHKLRTQLDKQAPREETIDLEEKQRAVLRIVLATADSGDKKPVTASPPISPLVWVGFGVGFVGVLAGTITGVVSLNASAELEEQCDSNKICPPAADATVDRAQLFAPISTTSFVVGGAGIALGVAALIWGGGDAPKKDESMIVPWLGPTQLGIAGRF